MISRQGERIVLPGLATAHSHAFQRALRGRTQRRSATQGTFWSWRALMYALAQRLDPESIFALSRFAFAELALAGVTAVGEFHYVQHGPGGAPYRDRIAMADAVVRAAREVGLRIALLRVVYERGGAGGELEPTQRRFVDRRLEDAFDDVLALQTRHTSDSAVSVGLAPHSVRAVSKPALEACARFARENALPLHAHVAEQRREIDECVAEHGMRPVELLHAVGAIDARFVAVHATHLSASEAHLLGDAGAFAAICRTTERDLGDGLPDVARLIASQVRLCTGVDSHAISDPFEEARAIELDERSRRELRHAALDADVLMGIASREGYCALGLEEHLAEDHVALDAKDAALAGADDLADAVLWGASPRAVREVVVAGRRIVEDGVLPNYEIIREAYERTLKSLV